MASFEKPPNEQGVEQNYRTEKTTYLLEVFLHLLIKWVHDWEAQRVKAHWIEEICADDAWETTNRSFWSTESLDPKSCKQSPVRKKEWKRMNEISPATNNHCLCREGIFLSSYWKCSASMLPITPTILRDNFTTSYKAVGKRGSYNSLECMTANSRMRLTALWGVKKPIHFS